MALTRRGFLAAACAGALPGQAKLKIVSLKAYPVVLGPRASLPASRSSPPITIRNGGEGWVLRTWRARWSWKSKPTRASSVTEWAAVEARAPTWWNIILSDLLIRRQSAEHRGALGPDVFLDADVRPERHRHHGAQRGGSGAVGYRRETRQSSRPPAFGRPGQRQGPGLLHGRGHGGGRGAWLPRLQVAHSARAERWPRGHEGQPCRSCAGSGTLSGRIRSS